MSAFNKLGVVLVVGVLKDKPCVVAGVPKLKPLPARFEPNEKPVKGAELAGVPVLLPSEKLNGVLEPDVISKFQKSLNITKKPKLFKQKMKASQGL